MDNQVNALGASRGTDADVRRRQTLIRTYWAALRGDLQAPQPPRLQARLYFDGGSRGNPGVAGSGATLVEHDNDSGEWRVVWWMTHFLGDAATNNEAEHDALYRGVIACRRRYEATSASLTIIGDSQLILGQVAGHTRSNHRNTYTAAQRTRRELQYLPSAVLRHTLRAGNRMADWLSNVAMDNRCWRQASSDWTDIDATLTSMLKEDNPSNLLRRPLQLLPQLSSILARADGRMIATTKRRRIATDPTTG